MKPTLKSLFMLLGCVMIRALVCRNANGASDGSPVSIQPDIQDATLYERQVILPFIVKNISSREVTFPVRWEDQVMSVMTMDDAGTAVDIGRFRKPNALVSWSGPGFVPVKLEPGEAKKLRSTYSMETFAYALGKGRKIFGELDVSVTSTQQKITARSKLFDVPVELTRIPWDELGERPYLKITVDVSKPDTEPTALSLPMKITNTGTESYIVYPYDVSFPANARKDSEPPLNGSLGESYGGDTPNAWDMFRGTKPIPGVPEADPTILKPGQTVDSYLDFGSDSARGKWKAGDPVTIGVASRIVGTNKAFESYSAPFPFPKVPAIRP